MRDEKTGRFLPGVNRSLEERFWAKVQKTGSCWFWTGAIDRAGYGRISSGKHGISLYAHRVSYEIHYGPLPSGKFVCHHCDARPCVRPDHLFVGDHRDNMVDMAAKGRWASERRWLNLPRGERHGSRTHPEAILKGQHNPSAKLTDAQVLEIRSSYTGKYGEQIRLARAYGVSFSLISQIVRDKIWCHLL